MGLFEDFSNFFETRLEEFLKDNPHLELQSFRRTVVGTGGGYLKINC